VNRRQAAAHVALYRRARQRFVRAKDTAIARKRLEPFAASFAVIEKLASIGRHRLDGLMAAFRTSQGGLKLHIDSCLAPSVAQEVWRYLNFFLRLALLAATGVSADSRASRSALSRSRLAGRIAFYLSADRSFFLKHSASTKRTSVGFGAHFPFAFLAGSIGDLSPSSQSCSSARASHAAAIRLNRL
jgi:hypothetical protein